MIIASKMLFLVSPAWLFLVSSFIFYLILYQAISFFSGILTASSLYFFTFWQDFSTLRRSGESTGLNNKKQVFVISTILTLGFSELFWTISFLPFSFFILGGILAVIFGVVLDIYREYFRRPVGNDLKTKKVLIRDTIVGVILIIIFIFLSPWLPQKVS